MAPLAERARDALADGRLELPALGGGNTPGRWTALVELAADDVDLARLGEAHVDAVEILREAGIDAPEGALLGVWASEHPSASVTVEALDGDDVVLRGRKAFCSGAGIVDEALVTAGSPDGPVLVRVPGAAMSPERIDLTAWEAPALRAVRTGTVDLDGLVLPASAVVGPPGWYLDRPGFWRGALGPAACWAGAAIGLVRLATERTGDDPHALAHLGGLVAAERVLRSVLDVAGREIDACPPDPDADRRRALEVRHAIDATCADVEERFARDLGPRALAFDGAAAERLQALGIYRRQCHGERDLATLGALVRSPRT
jgi:alkylation response protein AidB-like acyl-CoA dehydrogenase